MSSIINKSKWIVTVERRPDLTRAFPHYKGTEAKAYKQQLLSEDKLMAQIARGPLKLFVRIRTRGRPPQYLRVHSYEEAEDLDTTTRADELRGVAVNTTAARRTTTAQLIERYILKECVDHKGEDVEVWGFKGMLEDSRGELVRARQAFKEAKDRGENPKPVKARRQARTALEWLHLPFEEVRSTHLTAFKKARLKQVKPATVNRAALHRNGAGHWGSQFHKFPGTVGGPCISSGEPKRQNLIERGVICAGDDTIDVTHIFRHGEQNRSDVFSVGQGGVLEIQSDRLEPDADPATSGQPASRALIAGILDFRLVDERC